MITELTPTIETQLDIFDDQPLSKNPAAVYLAGLQSKRSRITQKQALDSVADMLGYVDAFEVPWGEVLRYQNVVAIKARLQETISQATGKPLSYTTVNRYLSAIKQTAGTAFDLEQMTGDDLMRITRIKGLKGDRIQSGRNLNIGEITALMQACENDLTIAGVRDAAIIAVMYSTGLRRAEVVSLNLEDYDHDFDDEIGQLKVLGKGNKERIVYTVNGARLALADWLQIRGDEPGPLFIPILKGGHLTTNGNGERTYPQMTSQAIYNMLAKRGKEAKVKGFSPHDLRRTFITDMLEKGADSYYVSKLAGHESVDTTALYDRGVEKGKQKVAGLLHVPYRGRLT